MKTPPAFAFCLLLFLAACASPPNLEPGSPLTLASFTENRVTVALFLELDSAGQVWLAAEFAPSGPDIHLYSMDIPREGVNGLGRPTLLELPPGSRMQAVGPLTASAEAAASDPDGLPLYPAGPVVLRLPVALPPGEGWIEDSVSVTYMACAAGSCYPPVIGRTIAVRVPGADVLRRP